MNIKIAFDPKKLKLVNPSTLKKDPNNRNKHTPEQIDRLCKLFEAHGMRWPIIVSEKTGVIKAGEGRLLAAIKLKMPQVLVSYQDFDSSELEYAFGVSDNAIGLWSRLDLPGIETDIEGLEGFDIDLLGIKPAITLNNIAAPDLEDFKDLDEPKKMKFYTCPNCETEFEEQQAQVRVE